MALIVDPRLVSKYDVPAPRYTSYPTALDFRSPCPEEVLGEEMASESASGLSLYVHLPFCESLCWFCGCTTVITTRHELADGYLDAVRRELILLGPRVGTDRPVKQVHLGGGSPTFLNADQLVNLGKILREVFPWQEDTECSVEVDPRHLNQAQVEALAEAGFRRASLGVQDIQPEVQRAVHRLQPWEKTVQAIERLRSAGFDSINLDLIYGLPHQTVESFTSTLRQVVEVKPDRLAVFNYAHVPWVKPAQKILERSGALPSAQCKLSMLCHTVERLTSEGYVAVGMDHFAREQDDLAQGLRTGTLHRNFQGYSTRAGLDLVGLGMSSISQTSRSYRQNTKDLDRYLQAIHRGQLPVERGLLLTDEDLVHRKVIMAVMCQQVVCLSALVGTEPGVWPDGWEESRERLKPLEQDGLVEVVEDRIRVTELGRLFLRNIAMCFDPRIHTDSGARRFSKAV